MYAPLKPKTGRKTKEKKKRNSVKDLIPETIPEKDSQVIDSSELVLVKDETNQTGEFHLVGKNEMGNFEAEKEQKNNKSMEESSIDVEFQFLSIEEAEQRTENCDSSSVVNLKTVKAETCDNVIDSNTNGLESSVISESCNEKSILSSKCVTEDPVPFSDYFHLATEVKNLIDQSSEPSAPTVEVNTANLNIARENRLYLKEISEERPEDISKHSLTLIIDENLIPFSEKKLSEYYYNSELNKCKNYIHDFIQDENDRTKKNNNTLYQLLVEYILSRNSLKSNQRKMQDLKKKLGDCLSSTWTVWDDVKVTEKEKCKDGNVISFSQRYTQAQFNPSVLRELTSLLMRIKNVAFEAHSVDSFICSLLKSKIEYYFQCLLTSCPEFTDWEKETSPISSSQTSSALNSHFQQCLLDLKMAISILFEFQRQIMDVDRTFIRESRLWLSDLVSILLKIGSFQDRMFLLGHIMRCPGGVGEWASHFVQVPYSTLPPDPFHHLEINYILSAMNVLLSPIEEREKFIRKWETEIANDVNPWTVIDSDGEIDDDDEQQQSRPLKENDLVSLLNQIPFSHLFKSVLRCNGKSITEGVVTSDYLLRLFSFLTDCVRILDSGLKVYSTQRYRQFTKRLGRLIYHIVQYATDALDIYKSQENVESEMARIQVEYDSFFFKSAKIIYSAKKHGTWQFLATLPYQMVSSDTILKLYGMLQLSDSQDEHVLKINFSNFEEKFLELPEEQQFYLLTTFSNMALARNVNEMNFIKNVLLQLFYFGYLCPSTMDRCYKNVKSLLCSICSKYPFLMSEILHIQERKFISDPANEQKLSSYLWRKLAVESWRPDKSDLEILRVWLLKPAQSVRHELAKLILQSLNYGINDGELFMSFESHRSIAFMILESSTQADVPSDAGVIKTVSNLVRLQSPEFATSDWIWNLLLKLRLHLLDQSDATFCKIYCNLGDYLKEIPNVESNNELLHLVLKRHPVACFVALMTTTLGHSVPIMFEQGFELVEVLFQAGKHEPSVACLEYMTLLFLDCCNSLYECEKFISLLGRIIVADNSYVQMAKNMISNNSPGPVLKNLEMMIQNQINHCRILNFANFGSIVRLWLMCLTRIPSWTQEPGVLYLIDRLLQNSFFDVTLTKVLTDMFENLLESNIPISEAKSSFSSLVSWMNSRYTPPTLLPKGFNGAVPWFSFMIIQMEYEINEKRNSVWIELLKELHANSDKKTNIDNSLKKVCHLLQIPVRPSSVLAIYKWSYQILETEISHPLIPLLWQKFFSLYLFKIPGLTDRGSVGEKFFDGVLNQGLYKRLKTRLEESCTNFKILADQSDPNQEQDHYIKCYKLFLAYSLWFDDPKMHEPCLSVHMLPIHYNPELLGLIIHGSETPWIEYLEYNHIEKNLREFSLKWCQLRNRLRDNKKSNVVRSVKQKSLVVKLNDRLSSYESPLSPPSVNLRKYINQRVSFDTLIHSDKILKFVEPLIKVLLDYGNQFIREMNENICVGSDMQELLPRLYVMKETEKILKDHCCGTSKSVGGKIVHYTCSGPAVVKLKYEESLVNERIKQHFDQCQEGFERNVEKALAPFPPRVVASAVSIDITIGELTKEYELAKSRSDGSSFAKDLKKSGVHLFYELVRNWRECIMETPPLEKTFKNYIDALGKTFVENNPEENDRILNLILNDAFIGVKLSSYFTPNSSSALEFVDNYSKVVQETSERALIALSRFDVKDWLSRDKPKFSEISRLVTTIGKGLKTVSNESEDEREMIKLLNQHLHLILIHDFPEHYGEVLNLLLDSNENQTIPRSSWYMFINALTFGSYKFGKEEGDSNILEPGQSVAKLKAFFSKYATEQNFISFEVIKGTINLLATTFRNERIKLGMFGLYRKYCSYMEPIFIFFGMLSYSCVVKALEIDSGSLSEHIAQQLWPLINDLYSPWLVPFWIESNKPKCGQWVQETNVDRVVTLPWVINDSCQASFCASIFSETIRFMLDALPGANHILSYVWYFYFTNFSHIFVKDHILNVIHECLLPLPWESFFPTLQDVELMLKVVDQFLPLCHSFLGNIFVKVKWTELIQYSLNAFDVETTTKLHICLLHLLVKLPLEPSLKQDEKVTALLNESNDYAWHLLDSNSYEVVLNWFVMSCDPRIVLMDERLEHFKLDSAILRLLQASAGYVPTAKLLHPTTLSKRVLFVKACVKWLITSNRRFKCKDSPLFRSALLRMWSDMESVVTETTPSSRRAEEASILVTEFLVIFKEQDLSFLVVDALNKWLLNRRSHVVVSGLLRSAGGSVENPIIFGTIIEYSLENYLSYSENWEWSEVTTLFEPFSKPDALLDKVLMDNDCFLTLYAILFKKFFVNPEGGLNSKPVLTDLLQLFSEVKPSLSQEPKLILLITFFLKLAENEIMSKPEDGVSYLIKFSDALNCFAFERGSVLLSALGIKRHSCTNRFRLLCLVASGGIGIFLKRNYSQYEKAVDERVFRALDAAESERSYQDIQPYACYAKSAANEATSLDELADFLKQLSLKLFNKLYLK